MEKARVKFKRIIRRSKIYYVLGKEGFKTNIFAIKLGIFGLHLVGEGHVRYIIILTWFRGFKVKPLYLVLFSLYPSLFWKSRSRARILIYRT